MDTHKNQYRLALQLAGQECLIELTVANSVREINKMVKKIIKQAPGPVAFCYEAGVCGFTLKRRGREDQTADGHRRHQTGTLQPPDIAQIGETAGRSVAYCPRSCHSRENGNPGNSEKPGPPHARG